MSTECPRMCQALCYLIPLPVLLEISCSFPFWKWEKSLENLQKNIKTLLKFTEWLWARTRIQTLVFLIPKHQLFSVNRVVLWNSSSPCPSRPCLQYFLLHENVSDPQGKVGQSLLPVLVPQCTQWTTVVCSSHHVVVVYVSAFPSAWGTRATASLSTRRLAGRWKERQLVKSWIPFLVFINCSTLTNLLYLTVFLHQPNSDDNAVGKTSST